MPVGVFMDALDVLFRTVETAEEIRKETNIIVDCAEVTSENSQVAIWTGVSQHTTPYNDYHQIFLNGL